MTVCAVGCVTTSGRGCGCGGGALGAGCAARRVRSAVRRGGAAAGGGGVEVAGACPATGAARLGGGGSTTTCGTGTEPGIGATGAAGAGAAGAGGPGAGVAGAPDCSDSGFGASGACGWAGADSCDRTCTDRRMVAGRSKHSRSTAVEPHKGKRITHSVIMLRGTIDKRLRRRTNPAFGARRADDGPNGIARTDQPAMKECVGGPRWYSPVGDRCSFTWESGEIISRENSTTSSDTTAATAAGRTAAAIRQSAENTVRFLQRLLCRPILVGIQIGSSTMADDEHIAVRAGLPRSRLTDRHRAQEHVKRKGEGRRGGNPSPQASLMSATSEHRIHLAEPPLALRQRKLKTK